MNRGIDFFEKLGAMQVLHLGSMMLLRKENTYTVLLVERQKLNRRQKQCVTLQLQEKNEEANKSNVEAFSSIFANIVRIMKITHERFS